MVFWDKLECVKYSRNGRKQSAKRSPVARSFSHPIQERGQFSRSVVQFMVEVFAIVALVGGILWVTDTVEWCREGRLA
jgi:hypothetical protein